MIRRMVTDGKSLVHRVMWYNFRPQLGSFEQLLLEKDLTFDPTYVHILQGAMKYVENPDIAKAIPGRLKVCMQASLWCLYLQA